MKSDNGGEKAARWEREGERVTGGQLLSLQLKFADAATAKL